MEGERVMQSHEEREKQEAALNAALLAALQALAAALPALVAAAERIAATMEARVPRTDYPSQPLTRAVIGSGGPPVEGSREIRRGPAE